MLPQLSEIQHKRRVLGLSQSKLASQCGISQSLVAKIESGKMQPSYQNAKAIFDFIEQQERKSSLCASDIATKLLISVYDTHTVSEAARLLRKSGISQVPVLSKSGLQTGSFSEETISGQIAANHDMARVMSSKVGTLMSEPFPQVSGQTPLSAVAALLMHNKAVLIVSGGAMKGIITKADLLKSIK